MDDTNTKSEIELLRKNLIASTNEISRRSTKISMIAKSDIDKIKSTSQVANLTDEDLKSLIATSSISQNSDNNQ